MERASRLWRRAEEAYLTPCGRRHSFLDGRRSKKNSATVGYKQAQEQRECVARIVRHKRCVRDRERIVPIHNGRCGGTTSIRTLSNSIAEEPYCAPVTLSFLQPFGRRHWLGCWSAQAQETKRQHNASTCKQTNRGMRPHLTLSALRNRFEYQLLRTTRRDSTCRNGVRRQALRH